MLVKIIDHKGKQRYINAAFVKSLTAKGDAQTDIEVSGWAVKVRVDMTPDAVAEILNAAMPLSLDTVLAESEQEQQQQTGSNAATIAIIG